MAKKMSYFRLRDRPRMQPLASVVWIGGAHAVEETLRAKPETVKELWVVHETQNAAIAEMIKWARKAGARVNFVSRGELDRATGNSHHQGVAVKAKNTSESNFGAFLENLTEQNKKGMVLVALDEIQDPHNLGAIARSAVNLGAQGLIIPERRSAPVTPAAVQASAGAIQKIKVFKVINMAQTLARCKENGFWIYGADAAGKTAWTVQLNMPLVLVVGSEGYGIRSLVKSSCDELLRIPESAGGVSSLNASCAASVLLYEIARQKSQAS